MALGLVPAPAAVAETVVEDVTVAAAIEAACTVTDSVLDFGPYDPERGTPVDGKASFTLDCPDEAQITIRLDGGLNPAGGERRMAGGRGDFLRYNLYSSSTRHSSQVWGDGISLGQPLVTTFLADLNTTRTVFGRLFAGQRVSPGGYSDTVTITVEVNGVP